MIRENGLSENAEIIIYDALKIIEKQAKLLVEIINKHGTKKDKIEYKECVYAPAIKLQVVLGKAGLDRQKKRYAKIKKEANEFFKRNSR